MNNEKNVAIVTIWDEKNYGNRLQNYATQQILISFGCNPISIKNSPPPKKRKAVIELLNFPKRILRKILYRDSIEERKRLFNKRKMNFKSWNDKYIAFSSFVIKEEDIFSSSLQSYDYFVVGSDQVWNPYFRRCFSLDFLTFAPKSRRVAYAASFGLPELPESVSQFYKERLEEFNTISVREESGAKIVHHLIGKDVPVLMNPTLMLTEDDWRSIAIFPNIPKQPLLVTYFLGNQDDSICSFISHHPILDSYQRIDLNSYQDKERFTIDPSEFLGYLCSADVVITDSFHGVIFSIIFRKPFVVLERQSNGFSMNTRIETLLKMFKLEDRFITKSGVFTADLLNIDFSYVESVIESEKAKAIEFLKASLNYDI